MESVSFLKNKFSKLPVLFEWFGESNSHLPDIRVSRCSDKSMLFWLDVKLSPAQGYQFVVQFTNGQFRFSKENKATNNEFSRMIIEHMNDYANKYKNPGTQGCILTCEKELLYNWVISQCMDKNVRFIVTSTDLGTYKALISVNDIPKYFRITGIYRVKRSGSRHLAAKHRNLAAKQLKDHLRSRSLQVDNIYIDGKRTITHINVSEPLVGDDLYFGDQYYLSVSKEQEGEYYIKHRGSTENANVIFILEYCGLEQELGIRDFQQDILAEL